MKTIFAGLALAASVVAAQAGGTYDSSGTVQGQAASEITVLGEGHMVMLLPTAHNNFEMADPNHPFADMSGTCTGAVEVIAAAVSGTGMCVYENAAGETMAIRWIGENFDADGGFHGQWLIAGGTGSLSGSTGGGDFISFTDESNGAQEVTLTGAMTLP